MGIIYDNTQMKEKNLNYVSNASGYYKLTNNVFCHNLTNAIRYVKPVADLGGGGGAAASPVSKQGAVATSTAYGVAWSLSDRLSPAPSPNTNHVPRTLFDI